MEIQRQCEGKMAPPTKLPMFSIDLLPKTSTLPLLGTKALMSPYPFFMKSPFQLSFYSLSSKLIPLSCLSRHEIWPWGWEDLYKQTWERKSDHMPLSRRRWRKQESQTVFSVPVHVRNWIKAKKKKKVPKYEAESKKEAESKEKISSAAPEWETLEKYNLGSK